MYSIFSGILVKDKDAYHIDCLADDELFTIFAHNKYIQFSKHENYCSKFYPKVDKEFTCIKCGKVVE